MTTTSTGGQGAAAPATSPRESPAHRTAAVDAAVDAALAAAPAAARASAAERGAWLRAAADALDAASEELVALADAETSLGSARLVGEVARTSAQLRLHAGVVAEGSYLEVAIDHEDSSTTPPTRDLRRMLVPIGPVAVYAASNFPFAFSVAGGDTASALAVGCPVVVKTHPGHPRTSARTHDVVAGALRAAGAPDGLFSTVAGFEDGLALVTHPSTTAAAFTGSVRGGRALADLAAARPAPIPFFGELGSLNPVVVTPAADAARGQALAEGLAASFTLGRGQFCTKPGLVFVPERSVLAAALPAAAAASATAAGPLLTEQIADGFAAGLADLSGTPGVEPLPTPGDGDGPGGGGGSVATVGAAAFVAAREVLTREVFGPATLLVRYDSPEALLEALAALEGSLTATLHAQDSDTEPWVDAVQARLEGLAGRVLFAGWPTGVAVGWAQHHGGPWPSTTNSQHTSVGATAGRRFLRPIAYQDAPAGRLPAALREENPLGLPRRVDGRLELPPVR